MTHTYLTYGCVLWGNNYEGPLSQLVRLQNKLVRKLPDILTLYTCQLFYDHVIDNKPSNRNLSLVSEQHNYAT